MDTKTDPKEGTAAEAPEKVEGTGDAVIEESALLKSIQDIEAKASGEKPAEEKPEADPKVATATVEKSLKETVDAEASPELKKGLEVSKFLREFVDILGLHVDSALQELGKSIAASGERGLASVKALGALAAQVENLSKSVKAFGDAPGKPAGDKGVTTDATAVLEKGAGDKGTATDSPASGMSHAEIFGACESLIKNAKDEAGAESWTKAMVRFDSTHSLTVPELQGIAAEHRRINTPAA